LLLTEYDSTIYGVSAVTAQDASAASSMPVRYGKGVTTGVQVVNLYYTTGDGVDSSAYSRQVDLNIDFTAGLGSFKVTVDPDNASAHNYTVNHSTASYNARLMESNGSTPFEFGATVPGGNVTTAYPESPCDVTITPYSAASLGGTAGDAVTMTIELDASVGAVGIRVQATTLTSVVIPGNKLLVPATGGLLAGIGTNNDPTVSVNIAGLASHTNVQDSDTMMMSVGGTLYEVAMEDVKTYVNEE